MQTSTTQVSFTTLTASPGKLLTDGSTYASVVSLPSGADASIWTEVDELEVPPEAPPEPSPVPVVRYSKYRIQLACQRRGLWERVKEAIARAGLQDSWANIIDIRSDNPELQMVLPTIETLFGATTVAAVLAESIIEQ